MKLKVPFPGQSGVKQTLLALALVTAYASASALPVFTLSPGAASPALAGSNVTADNIIVSDFATTVLSGTTFTQSGLLSVQDFQLGGTVAPAAGLNSTYGLYFQFSGSGTTSTGNPASTPTFGSFSTLTYTLYGYNGPAASFGFNGSNVPTVTFATPGTTPVALATGSLIQGSVGTLPATGGAAGFVPSANASLTFVPVSSEAGFFASPHPFYSMALTSFTNTVSQVEPFDGGFRIRQGGGAVNFASPVPEPETYALMLAGLGAVGWISRRRRKV